MSSAVVAVPPEMPLHELAQVLSEHEVSGVPIVDSEGHVVGVVSESDIVDKETGPDELPRGALRFLGHRGSRSRGEVTTAGEAMTSPPVVVEPWMSVYEAAWLMSVDDVSRLPVVDNGRLVGVIARSDLVRYFARADEDIASDVRDELALLSVSDVDVAVEQGNVELRGEVGSSADLRCLRHAISRVPGVVSVRQTVTLYPEREPAGSAAS